MVAISNYFASVGVKVDTKSLKDVDNFLAKIERKLSSGTGKKGLSIVPKVDVVAFEKHLRQVLRGIGGKSSGALRVKVKVSEEGIRKSLTHIIGNRTFKVPVTPVMSNRSLSALRTQIQQALMGVGVNIRLANVTQRNSGNRGSQGGSHSNSWSPNPAGGRGLSVVERLQGNPPKGSNSAAVRRHFDAMMSEGFLHPNAPPTLRQFAGEAVIGTIGRVGSSSMLGRGLGVAGSMLGGARLGGAGLVIGAALNMAVAGTKTIWSGLASLVTTPFKLIGGAANAVTSGFYRIALAVAPLIGGFMMLNRAVQQGQQRQIALNTVSKSLGSSGQAESKWLMDMAQRDGLRYNTLIDPYTTFIASASPAMGLAGAKDVFESFTQFGLTRGANDVSMGLAMKAVSQMAGKGKVQAEELRGQLGDAPGFGEMQGIFAQAYQASLGRTGDQALKGQKAIEELNKAMEKGQVISAKILPHVAQIAREMAEPGLLEARGSSFAEQARFENQIARGWANFRKGGGEDGLAYFWRMMQEMGTWWENNGEMLGGYFKILMVDLNTLRVGLKEFAEFAWGGKENDLTKILQEKLGIDVVTLRDNIVKIATQIFDLFERLATTFGFKKEGSYLKGMADKLGVFVENMSRVFEHINAMLASIERFMTAWSNFSALPLQTKMFSFLPGTPGNKEFAEMFSASSSLAYHGVAATLGAGKAVVDVVAGEASPSKPAPILPQARYRNPHAWGDNSVPPATSISKISLPQPLPQQMYTPAMQQNMQQISGNVNVNVNVTGDPSLAASIDSPQTQSVIRRQVQDGLQSLLLGSVPNAPKY